MADGTPLIEGVDYTGGANVAQLSAAGKRFACRYGGPGGSWKHLTPAEAQALSAAGIGIVANAEGSADGLLGGWSTGRSWAQLAESHFRVCGMPAGRPIYFSVDFDVTSTQWAAVAAGLRGAAEVLGGVHRVGVYGGRRAIELARRDDVARWFWQTYAWSGGYWVPGNHIEQYRNDVPLAGIRLDLDRGYGPDFGQWTVNGADMTPEQANQLFALYQAIIPDPPVRVQGSWTLTRPDGRTVPINPLYNAIDAVKEQVEKVAKPAPVPVDIAALVAALRPELVAIVRAELAGLRAGVKTDTRDAVADLGEAGAAGVRAEH